MSPRGTLLFIAVVAAACVSHAEELTGKEFAAGRKIYVAKCAKCHRFYEPANYTETEWRTWMEKMNKKAKLKPEQDELLNRYLDAYRAERLPGKPKAPPDNSTRDGESQRGK